MQYYIHNLDPVIIHLYGPLSIRWYGVSYLLSFLALYGIWRVFSARGKLEMPREEIGNFVVSVGVFGVLLGGRLGYVLFLWIGRCCQGSAFRCETLGRGDGQPWGYGWRGGLCVVCTRSSMGTAIGTLWIILSALLLLALFLGRMANFINGELWGRVSQVPWAVVFPQELGLYADSNVTKEDVLQMVETGLLQPRHPSQLYEAFAEGLLLFGILWWLRMRPWSARPGRLTVLFLLLYGTGRIAVEFYREPDSTVYFGWMTKGQLLSFGMLILAFALLVYHRLRSHARVAGDGGDATYTGANRR